MFAARMEEFRRRLDEDGIDVALITDDDNVYYLTGYYDYLHMEFGRPTILVVPRDDPTLLITPAIDLNSALSAARGRFLSSQPCFSPLPSVVERLLSPAAARAHDQGAGLYSDVPSATFGAAADESAYSDLFDPDTMADSDLAQPGYLDVAVAPAAQPGYLDVGATNEVALEYDSDDLDV